MRFGLAYGCMIKWLGKRTVSIVKKMSIASAPCRLRRGWGLLATAKLKDSRKITPEDISGQVDYLIENQNEAGWWPLLSLESDFGPDCLHIRNFLRRYRRYMHTQRAALGATNRKKSSMLQSISRP
jgi:hypothetical protein